jgi:hypothetical protein
MLRKQELLKSWKEEGQVGLPFCKSCGKELPSSARFCPSCGSPVAAVSSVPTQNHRTFDVSAKPRVVVASYVPGKISVKAGAEGKVDVDVDLRRAEDMDWNIYQQGDLITASFRNTSRTYWSWASHPDDGPRADISLTVPEKCDLDLENRLDKVSVIGVQGVIVVNSAVASVDATDCGGSVKVRTKTGSISLENVNGAVSAETATGQVRYSGSLASAENWFRTSIGLIDISLKGEPDLAVDAHSGIGQVTCTLPLAESRSQGGRVYGRLGAGTGRLRAETSTGNIRLGP